jgi:hypothetical protein
VRENYKSTEFGDTPFQDVNDEASVNEVEDDMSTGPEFGDPPFANEDLDAPVTACRRILNDLLDEKFKTYFYDPSWRNCMILERLQLSLNIVML